MSVTTHLLALSFVTVAGGVILSACSDKRVPDLEQRVAKLEADMASVKQAASASVSVGDSKKACADAKLACTDAWDKVLPGAEAARAAAGRGPATGRWYRPDLYDIPKAAHDACTSSGALKIRETGRAVKDAPDHPEVAQAKAASDAAFNACQDVQP